MDMKGRGGPSDGAVEDEPWKNGAIPLGHRADAFVDGWGLQGRKGQSRLAQGDQKGLRARVSNG